MLEKLIKFTLSNRFIALMAVIFIVIAGYFNYKKLPIDAFPDISPVMVPVFAEVDGLAPEEIERLITYPLETSLQGLPDVVNIKSTSAFGMLAIYVYFDDSVDIYFARQLMSERLNAAMANLPPNIESPSLGPISSGLGQVFTYYLRADKDKINTQGKDLNTYLRELNDWVVSRKILSVKGVTQVLSMGGHVLQYQIEANPKLMQQYKITLNDITNAVNKNNKNEGGQYLILGSEEALVRGIGLLETLEDLQHINIKEVNGMPINLSDVATVKIGNEIRRGVVTRNGQEEVVSGLVLKLYNANTSETIKDLYSAIENIKKTLPDGVELVAFYEQNALVQNSANTVSNAIIQGIILVIITLVLCLKSVRAGLIVALSIPFCAALAVFGLDFFNISLNLMSLGGIAIALGMLVDGSIIVIENIEQFFSKKEFLNKTKFELVYEAAKEVGRPILFALLIVMSVFLPIYTLEGVEGKMFYPLASSILLALGGSIIYGIFIAPSLALILLKRKSIVKVERDSQRFSISKLIITGYGKVVHLFLTIRYLIILIVAVVVAFSFNKIQKIGKEFMPQLQEYEIVITANMSPAISLEKATEKILQLEREVMKYSEVSEVISKTGRPEAGAHPHPVNFSEVYIKLKPQLEWRFDSKEKLVNDMRKNLGQIPGILLNFTQPIQNSFDELLAGTRAQLAINIYGEDLQKLSELSVEVQKVAQEIEGLVDVAAEQSFGQVQIQIKPNRKEMARYGVTANDIMELIKTAIGGNNIDTLYQNTRRFGINLRYAEDYRYDIEALQNLLIPNEGGKIIHLNQIAEVKLVETSIQINRQNNQRLWVVQANIQNRSLGDAVNELRQKINEKIKLPIGYSIEYGGQFENQERAMERLQIIITIVIAIIFMLLWVAFNSLRHALIVIINVPLAVVGGVFGLLFFDFYLSVPALIGLIALFGIAMQDAVVMVTDFNQLRHGRNPLSLRDAVIKGAQIRFRAVVMTTVTTLLGLLPLLLSSGVGSEIQRPLAATVVFGLASSTTLTLFVLPCVYYIVEKFAKRFTN
ncbi:CusA/CzcA family heavy metal efflux RND transporter [Lentisphaerota bacterium WC36G]|nr:CusA/CzcA family heavy metal efflux RND transporter [Lentisphaerae bacterium WC36]